MKKSIFKVMSDPRGFIRSLPKEKMGKVPLYLAWVIGMVYLMRQAAGFNLSFQYPFGAILIAAAILAIPFGYIILYLFTFFVYWAGKLFKGKATYSDIFSAAGYARVPEVFIVISWLILALVIGQATFTQVYLLPDLPPFITAMLYMQIVFYIWEFIITLHTIGEVQGFSAWMSLWNCILAGVIVVIISLVAQLLIAMIFSFKLYGTPSNADAEAVSLLFNLIT
ncbi:MAG: hypothetical protein S4CHLAM20_01180 [Chlamydiia bacterium]|nr:hypothetical protein [Chlamydiia bacterium]